MKPELAIRNRAPPVEGPEAQHNSLDMQPQIQFIDRADTTTNAPNENRLNKCVQRLAKQGCQEQGIPKTALQETSQMASNNRPSDCRRRIHTTSM